jgi:multidrug efflux system membrane fusion protein
MVNAEGSMVGVKAKRFATRLALLIVAVGLLGGMAWLVRGSSSPQAASVSPEAALSIPARLFTVTSQPASSTRALAGVVQARYETELAFRVGGKIAGRLVDVGSRVAAGDVLFRLELEDYELQLDSAAAELASAIATYKQAKADEDRMRTLKESRAVSDDEYDESLARLEVAVARSTAAERALELARNRLDYTTLEAPAGGIVTAIFAESGQVVAEGRSVAKLTQGDELEVVVDVPERLLAGLAESAASITYWSQPGVYSRTKLRELSPTADPITRTYEARFTILEARPGLQLGMSATLQLNSPQVNAGFVLPSGALAGNRSAPLVWKVLDEAGHVASVPVEVVSYGQDEIVVRGELSEGDRIVSAGVHRLDSGVTIRTWEELK